MRIPTQPRLLARRGRLARAPAAVARPDEAFDERRFLAVVALAGVGFGMTAPFTVLFARALGANELLAGVAVSSVAVSLLVVDLLGTKLVPRVDGRFAVWFSLVVFGAGSLVSAAAPDLPWMIGARVFQGVGAAFFMGGALQVVVRLAPDCRSGHAIGSFNAAWFCGVAVGPLLGGVMATQRAGAAGYRLTFLVCGFVCFAVALGARVWLPPIPSSRRPAVSLPRLARPRPGLRTRPPLALAGIGQALRGGLVLTMIPLLAEGPLGLDTATVGVGLSALAVVDIVAMRVGGGLTDRLGRRVVLVGALLSGAVACAATPFVAGATLFVIWCAACGVVVGVCWVVPTAVVVDVVEDQEAGLATYRLSADVGQLMGSVLAGAMIGLAGSARSVVAVGLGFALMARWVGRMPETGRLPVRVPVVPAVDA